MASVRVQLNMTGLRTVMRSSEVQSAVNLRAAKIAAAAGEGFIAKVSPYKYTARAYVQSNTAHAANRERKYKVLTKALGAAKE